MTRHSKNATSLGFYSYNERKKFRRDTASGSLREIIGEGSQRRFECCWLCNRPAIEPVATAQGLVYCKQCLFLNFEHQRKQYKEDMEDWQANQLKKHVAETEREATIKAKKEQEFLETQCGIVVDTPSDTTLVKSTYKISPLANKSEAREKNFWIRENTPSAPEKSADEPPSKRLHCPMTSKPLKIKELLYLKPEVTEGNSETTRWICCISKREIVHQKAVAIKKNGKIVLAEYFEKFVLNKPGIFGDKPITKSDMLPLISGGSSFSAKSSVEAKMFRACAQ